MIFGFGAGKIEIILEKFSFSPGEIIKGKVSFDLKKPTLAKKLKITLAGVRITTQQVRRPDNTPYTKTRENFIHHFEMPLDGEREYSRGEYPFEIKVPDNISDASLQKEAQGGILGAVLKTAEILSGMPSAIPSATSRVEWYLEASLEIPKAFDVKKKIEITVG
jgi:sporulation-control protein spo0M